MERSLCNPRLLPSAQSHVMQTRRAARVAAEEADTVLESASAHAVLFSQDLWHQHL
jgi:hypothetical protein